MNGACRSCLATGVALVGASTIAVSPVAPPVLDIKVASPAVQLTARPFDAYVQLLENTAANLAGAPVLEQVIANVELLGEALASGDPLEVLGAIVGTIQRTTAALGIAAEAIVTAPYWAAVSVLFNSVIQTSEIYHDLSDAVIAKGWLEVAYVVAEAPALFVNALLNGPIGGVTGGLLDGLKGIREAIAHELDPNPLHAVPEAIAEALAPNEEQSTATSTSTPEQTALVTVDIAQNADLTNVLTPAQDKDTIGTLPAEEPTEQPDTAVMNTETDTADEEDTETAEATDDTALVRNSLKAEPGKTGMTPNTADRPTPLKDLHDSIHATVNKIRDGVRSFTDSLGGHHGESSSSTGSSTDDA